MPGWPLLAFCTASTDRNRMVSMQRRSMDSNMSLHRWHDAWRVRWNEAARLCARAPTIVLQPTYRRDGVLCDPPAQTVEVQLQLGMIGLGRMGASMVRRLIAKGH